MNSKRYAEVYTKQCVACGACANICPLSAISIVHGCYAKVDITKCVGCGKCAANCPAGTIQLKERTAA